VFGTQYLRVIPTGLKNKTIIICIFSLPCETQSLQVGSAALSLSHVAHAQSVHRVCLSICRDEAIQLHMHALSAGMKGCGSSMAHALYVL
jgi:hypothetical protein